MFEPVREGLPYDSAAPRSTLSGLRDMTAIFADRGIGADAVRLAAATRTDVVVVDCLLLGALRTVRAAGLPTVSLVHTLWSFFAAEARGPIGAIMRIRGIRMRQALESPKLSLVTVRPRRCRPASGTSASSGGTSPSPRRRAPTRRGCWSA
ncbi:hypothetical protein Asi02nite_34000 [Asanoa siamensis]|uniref:Uncharacterized protein n=1 Tax=Asanoa siamensis TaxID=926357 RepID=A0ABQ4CSP8_9ACTN|nr:hypothetical protein Asi02nite_34000 [Asanoa siamensis]